MIHRCPVEGSGVTPCCNKTPYELPPTDQMTLDPSLVQCLVIAPSRQDMALHLANLETRLRQLEHALTVTTRD